MAKEISISQIPIFPLNLSGLVLFCIDTSDSESRRIFHRFSRSTRLSLLCTAPVLIFALFCTFSLNSPDFGKFADFSANRAFFAANFTEFCRSCGKLEREIFPLILSRGKGKTEKKRRVWVKGNSKSNARKREMAELQI